MELVEIVGALLAGAVAYSVIRYFWPSPSTVFEHQRGLRFHKGHLVGEVGPGRYWLNPRTDDVRIVDTRERLSVVSGQEVLTADRVPLKVSLVASFSVADVTKALTSVSKYEEALHTEIQLALRQTIAERDLDTALAERGEIGSAIAALVAPQAAEMGVVLTSVQVRDFMMAGGLRSAYSEVVQAKQQGLAALERARGESAAVRNLANTAGLMERHPGIMQLRLLQAVENSAGNRIVIALDPERGSGTELAVEAAES